MKDIDGNEIKKKTIAELTVHQFLWRVVGWLLFYTFLFYSVYFLIFVLLLS